MASFSKRSKLEIINQQIDFINCGIPFLYGIFVSSASYNEQEDVEIVTDIEGLYDFILKVSKNVIKNYKKILETQKLETKTINIFDKIISNNNLNEYIILKDGDLKINEKIFYKITFKDSIISKLFSLYDMKEESTLLENIKIVSKNSESLRSFIKGIYIGSATSSIKISEKPNQKTSSGYHLEFTSKNLSLLREVSHILAQFNIFANLIKRRNNYVLYIKDSENVSDVLALVGANNSVIALKSEIVKREFRNKINRQTNCLSGNISKTVEASIKQLQAIQKIDQKVGLNTLPPDLEEVALMRLANPEEPLTNLLRLSNMQLTKSGLNHRLRKLISLSKKL